VEIRHCQAALSGQIMDAAGCLAHTGGIRGCQWLIKQQQAGGIQQ
jgi:hypothetical protein